MVGRVHLAVDVGATWTRLAVAVDEVFVKKVVVRTPREGGRLAVAEEIARTFEKEFKEYREKVEAVGIGTIGPLDMRRGVVVNTPNLPLGTFELKRPLEDFFDRPVYVVNDAVAGVLAEKYYGDGVGYNNLVYVTISTGVGGGVIVDGRVILGKDGNAHEIGHIVVNYDSGLRCGCGGYGHWEAYAGGANIPRLAKYVAERNPSVVKVSVIGEKAASGSLEPREVFEAARRGDPLGRLIVDEIVKASAAGLASVINAYDPEYVSIGGSVFLHNTDLLYQPVVEIVKKNIVVRPPVIAPTKLGDDVVLYGALALAVYRPV
ncbi:ROK family protein [Thermogladius sp.]|uniref:ROK family protein n=1 Tax=Thermogladius sp. TaxID=2023064 RepID=UPI003D0DB361